MAVTDTAAPSRRQSLGRWLRIIVSAALLALLVTKIHPAWHRPLGMALATGARGIRRPGPAADPREALLRRAIRRERAPLDDRRRRRARQSGRDHDRLGQRFVRLGRLGTALGIHRAPP